MGDEEYVRAELKAMYEFSVAESKRQGRELTSNEAAELWIAGHLADFRTKYFGVSDGIKLSEEKRARES